MAPVELKALSSNWKKLQQSLQSEKKPKASSPAASTASPSLKRKRSLKEANAHSNSTKIPKEPQSLKGKSSKSSTQTSISLPSRKRQKMEEPPTIGASTKHHDVSSLTRSISMPSLRSSTLLTDPTAASDSISVLAASPHHPDIENEGVSESALPGKYVALDCEMVGVGPEPSRDSALARVSLVNYHGHQVYDSYVQMAPGVEVTDYRTAVSGIEPKHLRRDVARPFKEVQADVKILLEGRILVGHALKNDLGALILSHPRRDIRDTSKYPEFKKLARIPGRTPALKTLVAELLGVEIQSGQHSSVEDARATMALFRLEKAGFEQEIVKKYGHAKARVDNDGEEEEDVKVLDGAPLKRKKKNNKKKKKKKNTVMA
ncbi:hypothetical protein GQ43DRAFT_436999 [Delitschia confertaspora ATCC 74209]|uniref:RNA exonuclease 4 n=1 Tax=Delitschia confertaspora ATCC 74209 TaxID=1513339 RepID=A0A9P4MZN8_9PLEO|nr:hypothetical protein GQ43DRAFT_436999 [Delitschia confertaspora ATCC 74209]